jgi:hypothetical protein
LKGQQCLLHIEVTTSCQWPDHLKPVGFSLLKLHCPFASRVAMSRNLTSTYFTKKYNDHNKHRT